MREKVPFAPDRASNLEESFREELIQLLPSLRYYAMTLTRSRPDADDLVQETCQRALTCYHLFDGGNRLDRWLHHMMRNLWIDEIRRRKVRVGKGVVDAAQCDQLMVEPTGEDAVYVTQVSKLISSMPAGLATAFLLVSVEGRSYRDAAAIMEIPIGTITSRISAVRTRLAAMTGQTVERTAAPKTG